MPALSVRLIVPPSPIVAGRLYTVDCQVQHHQDDNTNDDDDDDDDDDGDDDDDVN